MPFQPFRLLSTPAAKLILISVLVLLLLIPMLMVKSIIHERQGLYRTASHEITQSWGSSVLITGPVLTLFHIKDQQVDTDWHNIASYQHLKPKTVITNTKVDTQIRYRGIYKVPVYTSVTELEGSFLLEKARDKNNRGSSFKLDEALLQIPFPNSDRLKKPIVLNWNGEEIPLEVQQDDNNTVLFTARLDADRITVGKEHSFRIQIELAGSERIDFAIPAEQLRINMQSNWVNPSFYGRQLPIEHEISEQGFNAHWTVTSLFKEFDYDGHETVSLEWLEPKLAYGVRFIQPVDTYQIVTRATKYAILFLGLTFLVYFLIEVVSQIRLHPIQYLLVGIGNCIFYLLLLSLAEHINFSLAYFVSAFSSIMLITLYSLGVIKDKLKTAAMFIVLSGLYVYLFITLRSQDYALLFGSVGLFCTLATVMYLTRRINWQAE